MAFNVSWSEYLTNSKLYGNLPKVSEKNKTEKTKIIWTYHETSRRDSIRVDFMAAITRKTEQREKTNTICGQSHERYQHGKSRRTTVTDAR